MSQFEQELPSVRLVKTHHGDDLQAVAAREMGDANRWPELVWLNQLVHPYLTDDERRAGPGVLLSGALLKVPAPVGVWTDDAEDGQVYERDCALAGRQLVATEGGDFAVLSGTDNLRQQLQHRIDTPRGQLRRHPEYGCLVHRLKGTVNGPTAGALGAEYVKSALAADYRVATVLSSTANVAGDAIKIKAAAKAVEGGVVELTTGG